MPENQTRTNLQKNLSVLISGGSGLIGRYLTSTLLTAGYEVSHLSRNNNQIGKVRVFFRDPEKRLIDPEGEPGLFWKNNENRIPVSIQFAQRCTD